MATTKFDTSEVLTENDYELMQQLKHVKKELFSYVNMEVLVDQIVDFITKCPMIDFRNERAKKYIDRKRPVFYLVVDLEASKEKYKNFNFKTDKEEVQYYSNIIHIEIISRVTTFINQSLKDVNFIDKVKDNDIFKDNTEEEKELLLKFGIITTLFGLRLDEKNKSSITLELLS